jgi:hypothetical protein
MKLAKKNGQRFPCRDWHPVYKSREKKCQRFPCRDWHPYNVECNMQYGMLSAGSTYAIAVALETCREYDPRVHRVTYDNTASFVITAYH